MSITISTRSVAEPEPPGAATFRMEPGPIFLLAGAESLKKDGFGCIFLASKKGKPCSCNKYDLRAIYKGKYDSIKGLALIMNFLRAQNDKF